MKVTKWGLYLLAIGALALFLGCTQSFEPSSQYNSVNIVQFQNVGVDITSGGGSSVRAEKWIESETGGVVSASFCSGDFSLKTIITVPSGALPFDTTFSILIPDAYTAEFYFEPSNIPFEKMVRVNIVYNSSKIDPSSPDWQNLKVFRFVGGDDWEIVPSLVLVSHGRMTVTFQLEHFSRYAIGRP